MIVTNKIKMDLTNRSLTPTVDVMQDDQFSRNLEISLYSGFEPFVLPENCVALVRYKKADGNSGAYDALPDGTPAWSINENVVTITLAPQVCNVVGKVSLTVVLFSEGYQLSSFVIDLYVRGGSVGNFECSQYINISNFMPQAKGAVIGQFLKVTGVNEGGYVTAVETAEMSGGAGAMFIVNVTQEEDEYQMDRTNEEIVAAFESGQTVCCRVNGMSLLPLSVCAEEICGFSGISYGENGPAIMMVISAKDGENTMCSGFNLPMFG